MRKAFSVDVKPDWEAFRDCILRKGTPKRVHFIELFLDEEVQEAICKRYGIGPEPDPNDLISGLKRQIALQRFLGYDYVRYRVEGFHMPLKRTAVEDTAALRREGGRGFMEEHKGPITSWGDFEKYPWPNPAAAPTPALEWYEKNLPDDMCLVASGGFGHFCEYLTWLMGYETLCFALYEQRDLVEAISRRLLEIYRVVLERLLHSGRMKIIWGSDDMGFKTGPMISPNDMRAFVLPGHKVMARMSHDAGRPYILHSCGDLRTIIAELIDEVRIDGKHSFEDTIERVTELKDTWGKRIALLGGIDVDFLCRANERQVRRRVRKTLEKCMPGGGYCLGTGNSVANYIPVDNYLAMLDEGRKWGRQR